MPSETSALQRARWALLVQFGGFGVLSAAWMSRMPSIKEILGVSALQLGSLLIVGGIGSLVGAMVIGTYVTRFGNRLTYATGTAGAAVGTALQVASVATGSVGLFMAGGFVNGLSSAFINVPLNVNGAAVERALRRSVLAQLHAGFSIGAAIGAAIGAGFSALGVHVGVQTAIVGAAITLLRFALLRPTTEFAAGAAPRPKSHGGGARASARTALGAWLEPRTLLLGVVLLAASLAEGTAGNWLSLAVVQGFGTLESTGALAYSTFVAAMTVFRLVGGRLVDRFGRVAALRVLGVSSLIGVLGFVFAPGLAVAWIGIVLWGFGSALGYPLAVAAASDDPTKAGPRVSVVTSFAMVSSLAAPPLLGILVDAVGPRHAMLVVVAVILVSLSVAGAVRRIPSGYTEPIPVQDATNR